MNTFIADVHTNLSKAGDSYDPTDHLQVRRRILDGFKDAVTRRFPLHNETNSLFIEDLKYDDPGKKFDKNSQKKAILRGESVTIPLRGRWVLKDADGNVTSKTAMRTLANVPWMTERGTFIRNGAEMTIPIQARLVSGVYVRKKDNGDVEAHVNVKQGSGRLFKILMDPMTSSFIMKQGTRSVKMYPLLKTLGATDAEIKAAWGDKVHKANMTDADRGDPWKSVRALAPPKPKSTADAQRNEAIEKTSAALSDDEIQSVRDAFDRMEIDPISTEMSLGRPYSKVTKDTLLAASGKLLGLARGRVKPDVRDSLLNQRFYDAPDIFAEHVLKDAGAMGRSLLWKVSNHGDTKKIPGGYLNKYIDAVFTQSRIPQVLEEINPLEIHQRRTAVTKMGSGGIGDVRSAPDSARQVQNSYQGFIDPSQTSESLKAGLVSQLAVDTRKGANGLLYAKVRDRATGRDVWLDNIRAVKEPMLIPGGYEKGNKTAMVLADHGVDFADPSKVRYELPSGDSMFALTANLVPFKGSVHAGRLLMGAKHGAQAMSLVNRQAPLVSTLMPDGTDSNSVLGDKLGAVRSPSKGVVARVTPSEIVVKHDDGTMTKTDLYRNFPFNRKAYLRNEPAVKAGDRVAKGSVLAGSNYTDKKGLGALGTNLKVAYMVHHGKNYRDSVAISESAAKKLTSEHMYSTNLETGKGVTRDKKAFVSAFPGKFDDKQFKKLSDDGVVKSGTILEFGDPVAVGVKETPASTSTMNRRILAPVIKTWDHPFPGVVTDAEEGRKGVNVLIRANQPAQVADKVAGRFGNKSVISEIIPDDKMPLDKNGKPVDILMSPLGIISRLNDAQVLEALLGKVAVKRGKPYVVPGFMKDSAVDYVRGELKKNDVPEGEDLRDPITNKTVKNVTTGVTHVYKLQHTAESKHSERGTGAYTLEEQPAPGGHSGAKSLGNLVLGALVGHDAMNVLKDMKLVKGQRNDDFWRDFKSGRNPSMPTTPLIYDKFLAHLSAAGINVKRDGAKVNIQAMTNKEADKLTGNSKVLNTDTFDAKNYKPLKGGLFDPAIFGDEGDQWGYVDLPVKLPNPVMEDPIRHVLGLTKKKYEEVLDGEAPLKGFQGKDALYKALNSLNVDGEMKSAEVAIGRETKSKRDAAIKKFRALHAMKANNVRPVDFMMSRVPVLPPKFRPISAGETSDVTLVADANFLYKKLMDGISDYNEAVEAKLPEDDVKEKRKFIYEDWKTLTGLSDPDGGKLEQKNVGGLLKWVFGKNSPKWGGFQRKVVGTNLDLSGRAVITPNANLKLNEVGLPEEQAWELYAPFTTRLLSQAGYAPTTAVKMVAAKHPAALQMLRKAVTQRPILITRAPALHKYSVMAMWPKLSKGRTLQIPPAIVHPFNADYDGDQQINSVMVLIPKSLKQGDLDTKNPLKTWLNEFSESKCQNLLEMISNPCYVNSMEELVSTKEVSMAYMRQSLNDIRDFNAYVVDLEDFPYCPDKLIGGKDNIYFYAVPEDVHTIALDESTGSPVVTQVAGWSVHRDKEVWTVQLSNGRQIFTDDDERAVYGMAKGTLSFTRNRPTNAKGMLVPVVKNTGKLCSEDMTEYSFETTLPDSCQLKNPLPLVKNVGYAIGAFIGDGWVCFTHDKIKQCCISSIYPNITNKIKQSVDEMFHTDTLDKWGNLASKTSYGNSQRHTISSRTLGELLVPLIGKGAQNKHLPVFWHRTTRAFRIGLLSGLLDTDGSVCVMHGKKKPQLSANYCSVSLRLTREIQQLLRSLDIRSTISFGKKTSNGNSSWTLSISAGDLRGIKDELVCVRHKTLESFEEVVPDMTSSAAIRRDLVPISSDIAEVLKNVEYASCPEQTEKGKYGRKPSSMYIALTKSVTTGYLTRAVALAAYDKHKDSLEHAELWSDIIHNEDVTWCHVKSAVNTGVLETGYDLTVPGYETFMSLDGIILSNTMSMYVPVSDDAVKEAVDKMTPEKNLLSARSFTAHYKPEEEYQFGIYLASRRGKGAPVRRFKTPADAVGAYNKGLIKVDEPVRIG